MNNIPGRSTLAGRITIVVLLASGLALGALTISYLGFEYHSSLSQLRSDLATTADVVGQNSAAALTFRDSAAATEVLAALHADAPVVLACLYDDNANLFAQYQRPSAQRTCSSRSDVMPTTLQLPYVSRDVVDHDRVVGTLCLVSDLQEVKQRCLNLLGVAVILLAFALGLGGVAGVFLQRDITRPVFTLAEAMQQVTENRALDVRIPVAGSCEIAQLGRGFNTMIAELQRHEREARSAREKLQYQALNDQLTGLPNRRLMNDRLTQAFSHAQRDHATLGLLYLDLDGFKLVNDSLGHSVGDRLLIQVADRMRTRVRKSDTLARIGGDEFTVILAPVRSLQDCATIASEFIELLAAPFEIDDHTIGISASIGISTYPESANDAVELVQQADCAMYAAKRSGKNSFQYYTMEMGVSVRERMNLETQLRHAVDRGEINVAYQPEFDADSGVLTRFEALARWSHPTLGEIPPAKFIPIAEESGIILSLGEYILENACRAALAWQSLYPTPIQVAVNVSSVQFGSPNFLRTISEVLRRTKLPASLLQIELTESVMLSGTDGTRHTMEALHQLGVSLAIDDFGTGYSSLSYLPALPFDALKIDRSFVLNLCTRTQSQNVFRSLVKLARDMGMRVIVEGVERSDQLAMAKLLGANEAQGFLLGKPTSEPITQIRKSVFDQKELVGEQA